MKQNNNATNDSLLNIWPALVDVVIATLMILLLFIIIQYLAFFLSDALKRMDILERQGRFEAMFNDMIKSFKSQEGFNKLFSENKKKGDNKKESKFQCITNGDHQILRFSSELLFDKGKAEISSNEIDRFSFLHSLGALLHKAYYKERLYDQIYIEGHTDNDQIRGRLKETFDTNWELSTSRAIFIMKFLTNVDNKYSVPSKNNKYLVPIIDEKRFLGVAGYAEFNKLVNNDSDENKGKNRRIEILLVYSER